MLYGLSNMINTPIDSVADAYEKNSLEYDETQKVADEIDALDVTGKFIMATGAAALGVSYLMYTRVPRVGKLASVITTITGITIGILGYDLQKSAQNIQTFFESNEFKQGKEKQTERKELKNKLISLAVQGHITQGLLSNYILNDTKE